MYLADSDVYFKNSPNEYYEEQNAIYRNEKSPLLEYFYDSPGNIDNSELVEYEQKYSDKYDTIITINSNRKKGKIQELYRMFMLDMRNTENNLDTLNSYKEKRELDNLFGVMGDEEAGLGDLLQNAYGSLSMSKRGKFLYYVARFLESELAKNLSENIWPESKLYGLKFFNLRFLKNLEDEDYLAFFGSLGELKYKKKAISLFLPEDNLSSIKLESLIYGISNIKLSNLVIKNSVVDQAMFGKLIDCLYDIDFMRGINLEGTFLNAENMHSLLRFVEWTNINQRYSKFKEKYERKKKARLSSKRLPQTYSDFNERMENNPERLSIVVENYLSFYDYLEGKNMELPRLTDLTQFELSLLYRDMKIIEDGKFIPELALSDGGEYDESFQYILDFLSKTKAGVGKLKIILENVRSKNLWYILDSLQPYTCIGILEIHFREIKEEDIEWMERFLMENHETEICGINLFIEKSKEIDIDFSMEKLRKALEANYVLKIFGVLIVDSRVNIRYNRNYLDLEEIKSGISSKKVKRTRR